MEKQQFRSDLAELQSVSNIRGRFAWVKVETAATDTHEA
jgi:hypothetical protein